MKHLPVLVCCLSLLAFSLPALHATEAEAPGAEPSPSPAAPATPAGALEVGPSAAPVPMTGGSCPDYYYYGLYRAFPAEAQQACADLCAQNGDTYYFHLNVGYVFHDCWCCPS